MQDLSSGKNRYQGIISYLICNIVGSHVELQPYSIYIEHWQYRLGCTLSEARRHIFLLRSQRHVAR